MLPGLKLQNRIGGWKPVIILDAHGARRINEQKWKQLFMVFGNDAMYPVLACLISLAYHAFLIQRSFRMKGLLQMCMSECMPAVCGTHRDQERALSSYSQSYRQL